MKRTLTAIAALWFVLCAQAGDTDISASCGTLITIAAHADKGYVFDHWSDDASIADTIRTIEIVQDTAIFAFFRDECPENGNWPMTNYRDGVLLADLNAINKMGFYPTEEHCSWYRVVGTKDDPTQEPFPVDDIHVGTGFSYSTGQSLIGSGKFYYIVDISETPQGRSCMQLQQSVVADLSGQGIDGTTATPKRIETYDIYGRRIAHDAPTHGVYIIRKIYEESTYSAPALLCR